MSLPAFPWDQRPDDLPLTADEVCAALAEAHGNVTAASIRLKVGSLVLRKFIERSPRARAVIQEMRWRLADKAEGKLSEALDDEDNRRVDWAIRYGTEQQECAQVGLVVIGGGGGCCARADDHHHAAGSVGGRDGDWAQGGGEAGD